MTSGYEPYVPALDASDEEVKKFVKRIINDESRFRRWHMLRKANNLWMHLGRHWMRPISSVRAGGSGIYHFEDLTRKASRQFPNPVDNMIATGINNEIARLGRKEYVPETSADSGQPELQQAARTAKNVLLYDLKQMMWAEIREALMFDLVATGTCIAHWYWDETQTEFSVVAAPDAAHCPSCGNAFASAKIPVQTAQMGFPSPMDGLPMPLMHSETFRDVEDDGSGRPPEVQMTHCPLCIEPTELQPRTPLPEEAENYDIFQRPMGLVVPKGQGVIEHDSPFYVYPENGGVDVEPRTCRIWGLKKVRDLSWIGSRLNCDARPEPPQELMRTHPTLGDKAFSETFTTDTDGGIYTCHAAVSQVFVDPMPGCEEGAVFTVVGEHVYRKPLMVEVEVPVPQGQAPKTKKVRRAKFGAHRRNRIPGQFWGRTPVDDAVPLQRRLNQIDAMDDDIRERGKPWMAVPMGTEFEYGDDPQGSLNVVGVDSPSGEYDEFKIVNAQPLTGNAYHETRSQIVASIRNILGPQEVEAGASGTAKTALEVKILSEQVEELRGPVERGLVENVYNPLFQQHLEGAWAFKKDDTEYEIEETAGQYAVDSYKGTDLLGQVKVKVESRGDFSKSVYQVQATKEAAEMGLYGDWQSDPVVRNQILENMDLPKVDGKAKLQILRAQQAWSEFLKDNFATPAFDPTIHDPATWYRVLNESWLGDEAVDLQKKADWRKFVDASAGWEKVLAQIEAEDAAQRQLYEGFPPETWPAIYEQTAAKAEAVAQADQKTMEAAAKVPGAVVPPPQPPPQIPKPPASGTFVPEALRIRVEMALKNKAASNGIPLPEALPPGVDPAALGPQMVLLPSLISTYAVIQAARLLSTPPPMAMPPGPMPAGPPPPEAPSAPPPMAG